MLGFVRLRPTPTSANQQAAAQHAWDGGFLSPQEIEPIQVRGSTVVLLHSAEGKGSTLVGL